VVLVDLLALLVAQLVAPPVVVVVVEHGGGPSHLSSSAFVSVVFPLPVPPATPTTKVSTALHSSSASILSKSIPVGARPGFPSGRRSRLDSIRAPFARTEFPSSRVPGGGCQWIPTVDCAPSPSSTDACLSARVDSTLLGVRHDLSPRRRHSPLADRRPRSRLPRRRHPGSRAE